MLQQLRTCRRAGGPLGHHQQRVAQLQHGRAFPISCRAVPQITDARCALLACAPQVLQPQTVQGLHVHRRRSRKAAGPNMTQRTLFAVDHFSVCFLLFVGGGGAVPALLLGPAAGMSPAQSGTRWSTQTTSSSRAAQMRSAAIPSTAASLSAALACFRQLSYSTPNTISMKP